MREICPSIASDVTDLSGWIMSDSMGVYRRSDMYPVKWWCENLWAWDDSIRKSHWHRKVWAWWNESRRSHPESHDKMRSNSQPNTCLITEDDHENQRGFINLVRKRKYAPVWRRECNVSKKIDELKSSTPATESNPHIKEASLRRKHDDIQASKSAGLARWLSIGSTKESSWG